jgi:hypothetical protein
MSARVPEARWLVRAVDLGLSLALYARLSRWKRVAALRHPQESTGFQVVARRRP